VTTSVAVIGGTGMNQWPGFEVKESRAVLTPYGKPSMPLLFGHVYGVDAVFLARHGEGHKLAPHAINYRANLWALHEVGVKSIVAISAVGGISANLPPAALAVPSDLVDYTWGREHSFCDGVEQPLKHAEFTDPYSARIRDALLRGAAAASIEIVDGGVMGVTQGPRLESRAEIRRMKQDGCDMVGMTGMPEAGLARELELDYASLAVSVNWAAGMGEGDIHGEIARFIAEGMEKVRRVLANALPLLVGS
jgi:5'-deoxy-5'-methylthioadenosine phosphorylase